MYGIALVSSFAIGLGIAISNGAYSLPAALCIAAALILLGVPWLRAVRGKRTPPGSDLRATLLAAAVLAIGMAWIGMNDERLVLYAVRPWYIALAALGGLGTLVASYVPAIVRGTRENPLFCDARFAVALLLVLVGGFDAIHASPAPKVDVWELEQQGADVLARGDNPYTHVAVKNSAPTKEALPDVPYVYTPVQLYVTVPAKRLAGDVRYAMLVAIVIAGAAMRFVASRTMPNAPAFARDAPALFYFLSPKLFFVIEQAWTEPVSVMFAALVLAAFVAKRPLATAVLLGLLFATKQTMIWIVPTAWLLLSLRPWQAATAFGVAGATALPFAGNFHALKYALLDFQNLLPPRRDGLTLGTMLDDLFGFGLPGVLGFVFAAVACGVSAWRLKGRPGAFVPAAAFTLLTFFFFNKWAFANYYFLTMGLAALAASLPEKALEPTC